MSSDRPPNPAPHHPSREPATVRVAMWSARHRWPVTVLWFVVTIGIFVLSGQMGGIRSLEASGNPNEDTVEAQKAYDVFNAGGTATPPSERFVVVLSGGPGVATDPAFRATVSDLVATLGAATADVDGVSMKTFDQLIDPLTAPPTADLTSADGSAMRIIGRIPGEPGPGSVPLDGPRPIIEPGPMGFATPGPTGQAEPAAAPITRMTNPATTRPRPSHSGARPVTGPGRGPSWPARTPAR